MREFADAVPNPRFPNARITYAVRDAQAGSAPSAFTLNVPVVVPLPPSDNVATFVWSASFGAITYRIQLSLNSNFNSVYYDEPLDPGLTTQIFFSNGGPTNYVRIAAVNDSGTTLSNSQSFDDA